ncbi:hypothetical protein ABTX85_36275 [Streptomyces sp. NPDC096097]|uniref:hypothetical protein n=1 Tax=Streptomyces sp. NPDC096097 TaxID=3155546 RepID=UPI003323A6B3
MPTLPDLVARFPLVPRPRPACLPLPQRIHGLTELAQTAAAAQDPVRASAVYNQAALLASDIGLPALASELCHQHANAYLHATPLTADTAIRALEPVVNLARLQLRLRQGDAGLYRLLRLSRAVSNGAADRFEGLLVPANLVKTTAARQEVRAWLWRVLLADGSRAYAAAGRWNEALSHVQQHRGVGARMLDGRQIAVVAALTAQETTAAAELIRATEPGEPWERAVTACLYALCRRAPAGLDRAQVDELVTAVFGVFDEPGPTVFDVRLGLTALDIIGSTPVAERLVHALHRQITHSCDGAAAREAHADATFNALSTKEERQSCQDLVQISGLGSGTLPQALRQNLQEAVQTSDRIIRNSHVRERVGDEGL